MTYQSRLRRSEFELGYQVVPVTLMAREFRGQSSSFPIRVGGGLRAVIASIVNLTQTRITWKKSFNKLLSI